MLVQTASSNVVLAPGGHLAPPPHSRLSSAQDHVAQYGLSEREKKAAAKKEKTSTSGKGMSGYMTFCNATREALKAELPGITGKDVMVTLGARWKEIAQEEKESWNAKAKVSFFAWRRMSFCV